MTLHGTIRHGAEWGVERVLTVMFERNRAATALTDTEQRAAHLGP
jgi:hypothetical protein